MRSEEKWIEAGGGSPEEGGETCLRSEEKWIEAGGGSPEEE